MKEKKGEREKGEGSKYKTKLDENIRALQKVQERSAGKGKGGGCNANAAPKRKNEWSVPDKERRENQRTKGGHIYSAKGKEVS